MAQIGIQDSYLDSPAVEQGQEAAAESRFAGETRGRGRPPTPLSVRFWRKVNKNGPVPPHVAGLGPCWVWTVDLKVLVYPVIRRDGPGAPGVRAHRLSWEIHRGAIPDGLSVLHKCDNPRCVNPDHLFLGTDADNSADKVAKGRQRAPRGEEMPNAKLTADKVREIRRRYASGGISAAKLGREYGIPAASVFDVIRRRRWAHVQ